MKAVLGFLFILVGVTVGWLVLSGKLPNPSPKDPSTAPTATDSQINSRYRNQNASTVQSNGSIVIRGNNFR